VPAGTQTGVLVIRAWLEQGLGEAALRARITQRLDAGSPAMGETAAASEEEILEAVRDWLEAFVDASVTDP